MRQFTERHIEEDCRKIKGVKDNALFFGCVFDDLTGLTLKDCDLNRSLFTTDSIRKAQDFTLTLNCHSFNNVSYSPLLFELLLYLMTTTKGNDERRQKIKDILGEDKMAAFDRVMKGLE